MSKGGAAADYEEVGIFPCHRAFKRYLVGHVKRVEHSVFTVYVHAVVCDSDGSAALWLTEHSRSQVLLAENVLSLKAIALSYTGIVYMGEGVALHILLGLPIIPVCIDSCATDTVGIISEGEVFVALHRW